MAGGTEKKAARPIWQSPYCCGAGLRDHTMLRSAGFAHGVSKLLIKFRFFGIIIGIKRHKPGGHNAAGKRAGPEPDRKTGAET
jgi:hypothetical protein